MLLDVGLRDGNGFSVCSAVKQRGGTAVIFLSASGDEYSVVTGLDLGADDYIAKPFRPRELVSRIRSVLRRTGRAQSVLDVGPLRVDTERACVSKNGQELSLSALEYRLLLVFLNHRGATLSRAQLLEEIWDVAGDFVNDNTLTVYIKRLRDKLEDNPAGADAHPHGARRRLPDGGLNDASKSGTAPGAAPGRTCDASRLGSGGALIRLAAACVTLALGVVLLGLYTVELCRRYRAMARLAADIDAVLHGSGDIHLADYGEGEVSLLRSEVRKMTLRLREQSAQLEKEKLQLADAMADISHQMRTPLTAVNLLLTSLAGHVDEESRGDVRALRRQVARMDWLVESLLKLAKLDAGTARFCPETIPLSALLARAAEPFAIGMELRGQQLQVEASGNVRCDPAWTAEALGNILKNCSEHMQEGTITVRAEENAVASVVVIRDTGGGIALQDLPHLFERYYKGENAPEQSVGIGLALSRSIAAAQNGTLTAANVPGGAEFTMKLYKGIV